MLRTNTINQPNTINMNLLKTVCAVIFLFLGLHTAVTAQTNDLSEIFKKHMNETVQQVKSTDNADEKRAILNTSYNKMLRAVEKVESGSQRTEDELAQLDAFKQKIVEKSSQLNGIDGFNEISDEDLDDFSDYSQQDIEQADRTVTISLTTVLLVVIILLLL